MSLDFWYFSECFYYLNQNIRNEEESNYKKGKIQRNWLNKFATFAEGKNLLCIN